MSSATKCPAFPERLTLNRLHNGTAAIAPTGGASRLERIIERVHSMCTTRENGNELTDPERWLQAEREVDAALETADTAATVAPCNALPLGS